MPRLITCWKRDSTGSRSPVAITHSGWARATSESMLIISGSNQSPNSMPSSVTLSTSGCSPFGQTSGDTVQSPRPESVVAPRAEPAVVEHVALDPERRRPLGQVDQAIEVVVEVDGLPDVDGDRPGGGRVVRRARAGSGGTDGRPRPARHRTTRTARARCRSRPRPGRPHRAAAARRRRSPARRWTAARRSARGCRSSRCGRPRSRPAGRRSPGCRACSTVAASAPGTTLAVLPEVDAHLQRAALGDPLLAPATAHVQHLAGHRRHREGRGQTLQLVAVRRRCWSPRPGPAAVRRRSDRA